MHLVDTLDCLPRGARCIEGIHNVDAPQHEHAILELYLTNGLTGETAVAGTDLARLQRAPEGAE